MREQVPSGAIPGGVDPSGAGPQLVVDNNAAWPPLNSDRFQAQAFDVWRPPRCHKYLLRSPLFLLASHPSTHHLLRALATRACKFGAQLHIDALVPQLFEQNLG